MLPSLIHLLRCPLCQGALETHVLEKQTARIKEATLTCASCGQLYIVSNFIPRMVPTNLYDPVPFCDNHSISLDALLSHWPDEETVVATLQAETQKNFGHEWEYYASLGWNEPSGADSSSTQESINWFQEKLLLTPADLQGRIVLDAGCGNGRFARVAIAMGCNLVGMDLTTAADVALRNLTADNKVAQIIQGDILHLPFAKEVFDVVYTIGVIQHTGKALAAAKKLSQLVRPDGLFAVRTYRKGNSRLEENDAAIRKVTTQFTLAELHEFSDLMHNLTTFLLRKGVLWDVTRHINLFPKRYDIFDWYSAPIAEKLRYRELRALFASCGIDVIRDADNGVDIEKRSFDAISILGRKQIQ